MEVKIEVVVLWVVLWSIMVVNQHFRGFQNNIYNHHTTQHKSS